VAEYRLWGMGESGNVYKVALMLALTGRDWEQVFVDFFKGETRGEAFRRDVNPLGEVPVLEHRGQRQTQSGVILDYLAAETGQFGPRNDEERREIWRWILFDNHKFTANFATLRFLVGLTGTGDPAVHDFLRGRTVAAFKDLDAHLASRSFVVGERPTIADLSLVGYQYFDEETGLDRSAFPNLNAWRDRIAQLPGWRHPYQLLRRGLPG
jgi:glutathione S-transferase